MSAREDVHPTGIGMSRSLLERHRTVAPAHTAASRRLRRRCDTPSDGGGSPPVADSWYAALSAPLRGSARPVLERQEDIGRPLDFVVRDTRGRRGTGPISAQLRLVRTGPRRRRRRPREGAVGARGALRQPRRARDQPRTLALRAAGGATEAVTRHADLMLIASPGTF